MALKLLEIEFPAEGPWRDEMAAQYEGLARHLSETTGMLWKIWKENPETGETGGIYLFEDQASLDAYLAEHLQRLESFGFRNVRAKSFEVNEPLTEITRGPLRG